MVTNESLITNCIKEKNNIKKKLGIYSEINQDYIDTFIDNKNRVFDALDNLLINDDVNNDMNNSNIKEDNNHVNNNNRDNNSSTHELKNLRHSKSKKKKHKKNISVPKLNFTEIFNLYDIGPLIIQEVKYESKFNDDDSINNNWKNIKIEKNNYHHHKKSKKKRN